MPRLKWWAGLGLWALLAASTEAQAPSRDTLFLTGQFSTLEKAEDGGGGGGEWAHAVSDDAAIGLGGFAFTLGGSRWAYGKLAGHVGYRGRTILAAELNLGSGARADGTDFDYVITRVELTQALVQRRLYLVAEEQIFSVDTARENLVRAGIIVSPVDPLSFRLNYYFATGGNVHSRIVSARADLDLGRVRLLAGGALGRTSPERLGVVGVERVTRDSHEGFVGVTVPIGGQEVTVLVDVTEQTGLHKVTTSLVWKIPF